jgi:HK97 family phage prohead protease
MKKIKITKKMNKILKQFDFQPNSINEKERSVVIYASTKDVDRMGDIIQPTAFDVKKINEKGLPILFNHNPNFPIGKSLWAKINDVGLMLKVYISDKTQVAKDVWNLILEGIISGASVGFIPTEWKETKEGYEFLKVDLLETSFTPIPANPGAVTLMMKKVESEEFKTLLTEQERDLRLKELSENMITKDYVDKYLENIKPPDIEPIEKELTEIKTKLNDLETSVKLSDEIVNGFNTKIKIIETLINNHKTWVNDRFLEIAGKLNSISNSVVTPESVEKQISGAIRRHIGKLD